MNLIDLYVAMNRFNVYYTLSDVLDPEWYYIQINDDMCCDVYARMEEIRTILMLDDDALLNLLTKNRTVKYLYLGAYVYFSDWKDAQEACKRVKAHLNSGRYLR